MSMEDFDHIFLMNDRIRSISIDMSNETLQLDVWRAGYVSRKSNKRKFEKDTITSMYDLSSVDKRDRKCLSRMLFKLNEIDDIECQFDVQIDTSQPEYYRLNMSILDPIKIQSLKNVLHECRSFCKTFEFDFPHNLIRAKCLRLAAPLTRKRLRLKR